ncbi:MAG: biopolymer transporter ExbD [Akkermansia sp.]|nr:biopolymer transporter ExbD [Akkermansia sp.]
MARHKQIRTEEQEDPEMNISSMIDCCFLLLIYFLVATSLVSEKKLDISIPATESSSSTPPPLEPGRIKVNADGSVVWNGDMTVGGPYDPQAKPKSAAYREQRKMDALVESLKALRDQAKAADTTPIVTVMGDAKAPQQRIVDVMAALAEADIHTVGLNTSSGDN